MKNCPYCKKPGDLYFTIFSRSYYRCFSCDLIYLDVQEPYEDKVAAYREDYFDRYAADQLGGRRISLYYHILEVIGKTRGSDRIGRLLDVGTGCGFFLVAAQKKGWEAKGIEPSVKSVEVARRQNGLDVFCGTLREYGEHTQFDAITLINVLEHSTIPWQEIDRVNELLRPGGLLYLRFPNGFLHSRIYNMTHKCSLSNLLRKFLVFHQYSFTPRFITKLLHDQGFTQTVIRNSPASEGDVNNLFPDAKIATYIKRFIYSIAKCTETLSRKRLFLGTSLEVTAIKSDYPSTC